MIFSDRTITILNNFASVHESIIIEPGNLLYTNRNDAVFAWTSVEETFDQQIAIASLPNFLSVLERFDHADVKFDDKMALVQKGKHRVRFKYTNAAVMQFQKLPFSADVKLSDMATVVGKLEKSDLVNMKKLASTIGAEIAQLICDNGKVMLRITKEKDREGNYFDIGIAKGVQLEDFIYTVDLSRMILAPDNYDVYVGTDKFIGFYGNALAVSYMFSINVPSSSKHAPQGGKP